jgi:hypothetical protein
VKVVMKKLSPEILRFSPAIRPPPVEVSI